MKPRSAFRLVRSGSRNLAIALVSLLAVNAASATSATWTGSTDALWATLTNWSANPVPGTGDTATFNAAAGLGGAVIDLGAGVTLNSILFDTSSAAAYTIGAGVLNSQTLTLNNGGSIILNSTVANNGLFNAGIILGTDATTQGYTFANNSTTNALTIAGDITGGTGGTAGTETLTVNGTGNTAISGIIGNGGATAVALTKSGAGTLTVSGANLFTGGVTLTTGNLNINSTTALGAAAGTFTINGGTIDNTSGAANVVANSNPITLGGNFAFSTSSGTALNNLTLPGAVSMATDRTITLNGAGALTLGGLMTNTADSVRTLMVNNGTGTTSSTLLTIGSFNLTGAGSTARNDIITGSGNVTISGVVGNGTTAGSGLTKFGTGTLTLNGVNTYTGSTIVNNGTLAIGSAGQLNSGGTVTVTTNSSGLFQYGSSANQTLSGTVNGAGALTKTGSGILTLSGTGITYLGATTINGGTLRLTSTTATNSAISVNTNGTLALNGAGWGGNQLITLNGGTLLTDENAGFVVNNWVVKVTADSVLQTSGTGIATNLSQYFLDGGLNIASGKTLTFNPSTVNNGIVLRYNAASSGSLVISGTGTTSNAGRSNLQFSTAGAANFANTDLTLTNATMNIGAGLNDANTAGATIKSLSGNGKVFDDTTANTLTVGANDGTGSFSGVLAGTVALSLTKAGTGTQELSGINTYTGTTTINAGTLKISGSPTGNSATTLNGGTLQLDYTTNNTSKIHDSAILTLAGGTLDLKGGTTNVEVVASTTLTGGLSNVTQSQAGSVLRMGAITPGVGVVNFGADSIASTSNANNSAGILGGWATRGSTWAVNSGTVENGTNNYISAYTGTFTDVNRLGTGNTIASSANSNVRIIDGGTTGDITSAASGTTDIASLLQSATGGTAAYTPGTTDVLRLGAAGGILVPSGAGGLTIGNAVGNGQLTAGGNVLNGVGTLSITNNSANPVTINSALVNNGSGAVALATAGNVTLNGVNTYTGTTGIGGGTLTIAGTGSLNSGSYAGAIQIGGGGTLNFNSTASQTLSGGISGAGGLAKNNTSTLTLSGTNSYFGGTVINAGAISTLSTTALGNAYSPLTVNNTNTGAGTAVALNINTSNTRRDLTIGNLSGTLATPSSGTNTATIYINGNSILTINQATPKTFDGLVSSGTAGNGGGGLIYNGPSTLTLTRGFTVGGSANAATSNTVIQGGTLIVQGGSSTGGINGSWGTTQIQNGGTLVLDGMNASYWNGNGGQVLGNAGNGSGLTIRNGATWGDSMPIGGANSNNNTMTVTGIGSTATAAVTIGNSAGANGNSLIVQQGGAVWGGAATTGVAINLGSNATSLNNFLIVDGSSGGALAVGTLRVGNTGASSGNAMTIRNGGVFNSTAAAILGNAAGSNTNSATVTGVGSLWNLSNTNLTVGGTATSNGNGLYVLNGGLVSNVATLAIGTTTATGDLVNLGDGNATSTLSATAVTLAGATDTLNFNNGVLMARAGGGSLVSGSGTVNLVGAGTVNTNSFATTISSVIAGAGALNKTGAGTLTVSTNTNTYTGGTNVSNGTLLLSGAINMPASGTLAVGAGGAFSLNDATVRTSTTAASLGLVSGAALQFDWALGTASN
ncbi:MAG: autotransporter-associated beta strand repeat-containing protein, partial [Verrucomicrobiota bacterium]